MVRETILKVLLFFELLLLSGAYILKQYFTDLESLSTYLNVGMIYVIVIAVAFLLLIVTKKRFRTSHLFMLLGFMLVVFSAIDHYYLTMQSFKIDLSIIGFLAVTLVLALFDPPKKRRVRRRLSLKQKQAALRKKLNQTNSYYQPIYRRAEDRKVPTTKEIVKAKPKQEVVKTHTLSSHTPSTGKAVTSVTARPVNQAHYRAGPSTLVQFKNNVFNMFKNPKKLFVGSTGGKRIHNPNCIIAARIPKKKRSIFHSKEDAVKAGFSACGVCVPFE